MKEEKAIINKEYYDRITPRIVYYLKSKNIARISKNKCPIFAVGRKGIINLFSNSLEDMGNFFGHKLCIQSLCPISNIILASGPDDKTIKIWNIADRSIISTLSGHTKEISALCSVKEEVLVSGSYDNSLIIWSKSTPELPTYSYRQVLREHNSHISGIIRINKREIISGEYLGDLRMWNIDQGLCIIHIPNCSGFDCLYQMKQHIGGDVVVSYRNKLKVFGAANDLVNISIRQLNYVCNGYSIEFLSGDLLLRGGNIDGQLEFIDYGEIGCELPPIIKRLHLKRINAIQRIAKNIVVTASTDGYLKVIHPISRICYLKFKARESLQALAYFY